MRNITLAVCGFYWFVGQENAQERNGQFANINEKEQRVWKFSFAELKKSAVKKKSQLFVESKQKEMEFLKKPSKKSLSTNSPVKYKIQKK